MNFLATPEVIPAIPTSIGTVVKSLGSNKDGTMYSLPNSTSAPKWAAFTVSGTGFLAS